MRLIFSIFHGIPKYLFIPSFLAKTCLENIALEHQIHPNSYRNFKLFSPQIRNRNLALHSIDTTHQFSLTLHWHYTSI